MLHGVISHPDATSYDKKLKTSTLLNMVYDLSVLKYCKTIKMKQVNQTNDKLEANIKLKFLHIIAIFRDLVSNCQRKENAFLNHEIHVLFDHGFKCKK